MNKQTFKPIRDGLVEALDAAKKCVKAMTPEEREEMYCRQRESFVRGMTTPCEHGELDFEQCTKCRYGSGIDAR